MKFLFTCWISLFCFVFAANAQSENQTLFTIDGEEYSVGQFMKSYNKNSEVVSSYSESVEEHLERFINFHIKLKSAYDIQLDTLSSFKKEFDSYYKQIADNYISNGEVTEAMVKETYDRTKTEVRASHILLKLPKHEKDTSEVYRKALMIKKRIENGEDFEALAKEYSEDPSVKDNDGDMNWFNTFKMVYEFEDATYKLDVGEISNPVRTDFGYHIIKKTGERPSRGKLETAHIMLLPGDTLQDPEVRIQKIYKRLQEGEDFHELAKQYSQDTNTASKGGYVPAFDLGGLNSKIYENIAYELEKEGDFSKPFQTRFGWHIVKLIKTIPLEPYEEVKQDFKNRLKSSSRSKLLISKIKKNLETLYEVEVNQEAKDYFVNLLDSSYAEGKWRYEPAKSSDSNVIVKIEDTHIDYDAFGSYLEKQQRSLSKEPGNEALIDQAIDDIVYRELLAFHKTRLPEIDEEFAERVEEFKSGILIFDYMKSQVWEPVAEDTLSQKEFYEDHKSDFKIPPKAKGQFYTSKNKKSLEKLKSVMKNRDINDTTAVELPEDIILEEVSLEKSSSKLPKKFKFEEGLSEIYKHSDQFLLMNVNEIEEAKIPEPDKVRGKIISKLQEQKEQKLISDLREDYEIVIHDEVLKIIKEKLEK